MEERIMNRFEQNQITVLVTGGSGFIGRELIRLLSENKYLIINLDVVAPKSYFKGESWIFCSILDFNELARNYESIKPGAVIHLAAVAKMDGVSLKEFSPNIEGTQNLIKLVEKHNPNHFVITSTQHVREPGSGTAYSDIDYVPYRLYGQSKMMSEILVRSSQDLNHWTIVRPTAVWGASNPILRSGLWRLMRRKLYFHPRGDKAIKNYGYVENVAWQFLRIIQLDPKITNGKTLYLGDSNMLQKDWIDSFSMNLIGRKPVILPRLILRGISELGSFLKLFGMQFPLFRERYNNLVTSNPVPIEPTILLLGTPPIDFESAVQKTVKLLLLAEK